MYKLIYALLAFFLLASCSSKPKKWTYTQSVSLNGATPIGLASTANGLWISDGDHNQILLLNEDWTVVDTIKGVERPMHIAALDETIFVPEYGKNQITILQNGLLNPLPLNDSLDAPAGVDVNQKEIAIADFYNHRILYYNGEKWLTFGSEGKGKGQFYYPTDVHIGKDILFVADAYNNRIQSFSKAGEALNIIGEQQKMNAATGIFVDEQVIYITDFEHDRVLSFNLKGELIQILTEGIEKPTDILIRNNELLITNYKSKSIARYQFN